jgi:putative hemolysin
MSEKKFIDISKVLSERAPKLKRWLPWFVVNWLKRKLHENDINRIMNAIQNYYGLEYNAKGLEQLGVNVETVHTDRLPVKGRIIVAANHPLGGLDGMALIKAVGDLRPDVHFVVNDVLQNLKNYGEVFVGINTITSTSTKSLRVMEDFLLSNDAVLFFPSGMVSRKQKGKIKDLPWKKSFITQAIDHQRLIVPTYIEGRNSNFFYRFANFRKNIGISKNIEMLFLPDEMFRQSGQTVKIHFGVPFDSAILDESRSHRAWANMVKDYIYSEEFHKGIPFEEFIKKN